MTTLAMGARLDRLPLSAFHRRMLVLIGLGLFVDSFEVTLMASVLGALVQSGLSDVATNAKFISATFAGLAVGAVFAGYVGDRFGRRFAYQFNLLLFGLMSFLAAMAPSMPWLIAARFFMGVGMGAEFVIGYGFISEFVPPKSRGRCIAVIALASNSAQLISAVVALAVIPLFGWRWMFVIAGVLALVVWFLRKSMPESPRWLEAVGRREEAEATIRAIEQESGGATVKAEPVVVPAETGEATTLALLFKPPVLQRTLLGILVTVVALVGTYGFTAWLPTFLVKQGYSIVQSLWYSMLMSIGAVAGPALGLYFTDKLGRKYGIAAVAIFAAIVGTTYPHLTSIAAITVCGFFLVASILLLVALGLGTYVPELFPTSYRMRGSGLCQFAGRVATIFTPYAVVALFGAYGVGGVVFSISGLFVVLAVVMLVFGIETKGKSLETISQGALAPGEGAAASLVDRPVKVG
jgi:putative MFS transporter